jgi:hypothetical protein
MDAAEHLAAQGQVVRGLFEATDHDHVAEPVDQLVLRQAAQVGG